MKPWAETTRPRAFAPDNDMKRIPYLTRRDFIRGSLAMGTILILLKNILAQGASPNAKLNIAMIGLGYCRCPHGGAAGAVAVVQSLRLFLLFDAGEGEYDD